MLMTDTIRLVFESVYVAAAFTTSRTGGRGVEHVESVLR
jgi:hypothetical protein